MPPSPRAERRLDAALARSWPLPDDAGEDKRGRGTVLVVGGSAATPGAVLLAGVAALRAGAGRLQIATAPEAAGSLAVAVPEALVISFDGAELDGHLERAQAVLVGPGLGDPDEARELTRRAMRHVAPDVPLVLDALSISALADLDRSTADRRQLVLTPNREELQRILDDETEDPERRAAERFGAVVISFGCLALPDGDLYVDPSPVRGLGTSGAGDVLAGAAAGLAARCGDGRRAACWALLAHRRAADRLARRIGPVGYLARELGDELPLALTDLAGA